jgi:hypothetical protein
MYVLLVTNVVNDCRDFIRFSTKGCIVLAAFEVVGVNSNENFKNKTQNLDNKEEKHAFLEKLASDIVNMCVATTTFKLTDEEHNCQRRNRVPCGFPGCPKSFAVNGRCLQKHRSTCRYQHFTILDPTTECANNVFDNSISDNKFNYSCNILREGLMDWCREDAAKENDGDRLVRLWRFDFPRFTLTNHTKYRLLAFKL